VYNRTHKNNHTNNKLNSTFLGYKRACVVILPALLVMTSVLPGCSRVRRNSPRSNNETSLQSSVPWTNFNKKIQVPIDPAVSLCAAISPDGKIIALGGRRLVLLRMSDLLHGSDHMIILDRSDQRPIKPILEFTTFPSYVVYSAAFSPNGKTIAAGCSDGTVKLWQISDKKLIKTFRGHMGIVSSVSFSPNGTVIASGGLDGTIKLWRVSNGERIRTLVDEYNTSGICSVAFSPKATTLVSGELNGRVKLWYASQGKVKTEDIGIPRGPGWSTAFSPDGNLLALGTKGGTIELYRVSDSNLLWIRSDGKDAEEIRSLAFSPDGSMIVSGGEDKVIRLWRTFDGKFLPH
jgi:WD40 repeat protein